MIIKGAVNCVRGAVGDSSNEILSRPNDTLTPGISKQMQLLGTQTNVFMLSKHESSGIQQPLTIA